VVVAGVSAPAPEVSRRRKRPRASFVALVAVALVSTIGLALFAYRRAHGARFRFSTRALDDTTTYSFGLFDEGRLLLTAGQVKGERSRRIQIWSLEGDAPEQIYTDEVRECWSVSGAASSDVFMTAELGASPKVGRIFSARSRKQLATVPLDYVDYHGTWTYQPGQLFAYSALSPRGDLVAAGRRDAEVEIRSTRSGELLKTLIVPKGIWTPDNPIAVQVTFSPGERFVRAREFGLSFPIVWSFPEGEANVKTIDVSHANFREAITDAGTLVIAWINEHNELRITRYSIADGTKLHQLEFGQDVLLAMSTAGERLATIDGTRSNLEVRATDTGRVVFRVRLSERWDFWTCKATLSAGGDRLALRYPNGVVEVWDVP
jgi:hypothetical protein